MKIETIMHFPKAEVVQLNKHKDSDGNTRAVLVLESTLSQTNAEAMGLKFYTDGVCTLPFENFKVDSELENVQVDLPTPGVENQVSQLIPEKISKPSISKDDDGLHVKFRIHFKREDSQLVDLFFDVYATFTFVVRPIQGNLFGKDTPAVDANTGEPVAAAEGGETPTGGKLLEFGKRPPTQTPDEFPVADSSGHYREMEATSRPFSFEKKAKVNIRTIELQDGWIAGWRCSYEFRHKRNIEEYLTTQSKPFGSTAEAVYHAARAVFDFSREVLSQTRAKDEVRAVEAVLAWVTEMVPELAREITPAPEADEPVEVPETLH